MAKKDTLYVVVDYKYFYFNNNNTNDTFVGRFTTLHRFESNGEPSTAIVRSVFRYGADSFFIMPYMGTYKGNLFVSVVKFTNENSNGKYLAEYGLDDKAYTFSKLVDNDLPPVYTNTNYSTSKLYGKYYCLELEDKIYSLENDEIIDIGRFPKDNSATLYVPPKMMVWDFRVDGDFVWMLYTKPQGHTFHYYKYNYRTRQMIFDKDLAYVQGDAVTIDDMDFDYILYLQPNNVISRKKIEKLGIVNLI
ncbi:MAG: hypothetical protein QM642_10535 [Edaphocola sp.]